MHAPRHHRKKCHRSRQHLLVRVPGQPEVALNVEHATAATVLCWMRSAHAGLQKIPAEHRKDRLAHVSAAVLDINDNAITTG